MNLVKPPQASMGQFSLREQNFRGFTTDVLLNSNVPYQTDFTAELTGDDTSMHFDETFAAQTPFKNRWSRDD